MHAWMVWGAAGLFVLYQVVLQASASIMEQGLIHDLHISNAQLGALGSSFYYTYLTLQIPAGLVVAHYGPRKAMTIGLIGCAVSALGFGFSQNLDTAEAMRVLMGMFAAPAVVSTLTIASRWFSPAKFALLAGLTEMLGSIGGALGQDLLSLVVAEWGWRITMFTCAGTGVVLALLAWGAVRDIPAKSYPGTASGGESRPLKINLRRVLGSFQIWNVGMICGLIFAVATAFALLWSVPFLQTKYGMSLTHAALATSMLLWGNVIGLPSVGGLSSRLSRRKPVLRLGGLGSLALISIIIYGPPLPFIGICVVLFLCGLTSSVYVLAFEIAGEISAPDDRSAVLGMTNMLCMLMGGWLLQPLIGLLLQPTTPPAGSEVSVISINNYQTALSVLPAGIGLAMILLFFLPETGGLRTDLRKRK
ncbi:MAG: MFS transporter [Puniceicoccales bacterium]